MEELREGIARIVYPEIFTQCAQLEVDLLEKEHEEENKLPKPVVECEVVSSDLYKLLSALTRRSLVFDRTFRIPTEQSWKEFLAADDTDDLDYEKEFHDCDNFGVELAVRAKKWLPGCSTGLITSHKHAWTFIILKDEKGDLVVRNIEPQTDGGISEENLEDIFTMIMW